MVEVFVDGASLGNPGPGGAGIVIYKKGKLFKKIALYIGEVTNNFAEYIALIVALQEVLALREKEARIYIDSELVVRQIKGKYRIKSRELYPLSVVVKNLLFLAGDCKIFHIRRKENSLADNLAKKGAQRLGVLIPENQGGRL